MYSPLKFFINTCIYVSIKTLIFVLAFLTFNPKILKPFPNTFPTKMKPYKSCILNAQQKEKKNKRRKVKEDGRSEQKENCSLIPLNSWQCPATFS